MKDFIEVTDRNGTTIGIRLRYIIRYSDRLIVIGGGAPTAIAVLEDLEQIRFKIADQRPSLWDRVKAVWS